MTVVGIFSWIEYHFVNAAAGAVVETPHWKEVSSVDANLALHTHEACLGDVVFEMVPHRLSVFIGRRLGLKDGSWTIIRVGLA